MVFKASRGPRGSNRRSSLPAAAAATELGQEACERSLDPEPSELDPNPDPARGLRLDTLVARLDGGSSRRSLFSLLGHDQPDPARTRLADLVWDDETRSLGLLSGWGDDETRSLDPGYDEASIIGRDRDRDDETRIVGEGWAGYTGGLGGGGGARDNEKKTRAFFEIWDDETRSLISEEEEEDDDDDTTRTHGPLDGETWASGRDIDGSRSCGEAWEWEDETRTQSPGSGVDETRTLGLGPGADETRTRGPGPGVDETRAPAVWGGDEACTLVACEPWDDETRTIVVPGSWAPPSAPPRRGRWPRRGRRGPGWVMGLESILAEPAGDLPMTEDEMCRVLMGPPDHKLLFNNDDYGDGGCHGDKNDGVSSEGEDEEVAGFEIVAIADKEDGQMIHVSHQPTHQVEKYGAGADDKGWIDLSPAASAVPELEEETWIVALEAHVRAASGPRPTAHQQQAAACDPVLSSSACSTKVVAVGSVTETEA